MTYLNLVWNVHEQLCIAALDCGDDETAQVSDLLVAQLVVSKCYLPCSEAFVGGPCQAVPEQFASEEA